MTTPYDLVGPLALPMEPPVVQAPGPSNAGEVLTAAPGDPLLVALGSFLATVLQAEVGDAWATLYPNEGEVPNGLRDGRVGKTVVRNVFFTDPRLVTKGFDDRQLPALFLYRAAQQGTVEYRATDDTRETTLVMLDWIPPQETQLLRRSLIYTMSNAIRIAIAKAMHYGQHRAWVRDEDLEQRAILLLPHPTAIAPVTITSFDGPSATIPFNPGRPLLLETAPTSVPIYATTQALVFTGVDGAGRPVSDSVKLTQLQGGERVRLVWPMVTITSATFPAMLATGGTISIGVGGNPYAAEGSPIEPAANAVILVQKPGAVVPLTFRKLLDEAPPPPPGAFEAFEMIFAVSDDPEGDAEPFVLGGPRLHADPLGGADFTVELPNGATFLADSY